DGGGAASGNGGAVAELQVGIAAMHHASTQCDAQFVGNDGAAHVEVGLIGIPGVAVLFQSCVQSDRATPFLRNFASDDVDYPAHGIRAIQRGHWAADDLDPFDGGHGGNKAGG